MRHRRVAWLFAALIGLALLWPSDVAAQRRRTSRGVGHAVPAARVVRVARPAYSRWYYPYSSYSLYWGLGYSWYPYPYFYGPYGYWPYADPFWYGYGPWGPRSYYYDDYASVRVQASPRDAQVYVDGYFVGVVDDFDGVLQRLRLPPGGHDITLHLNGYRNASERMYLQPHSTYRLRTRLEPRPQGAPQDPLPAPNPAAVGGAEREGPGMERPPSEPEPAGPPSRRWPPRQQAEEREPAQESRFGTLTLRIQPADSEVLIDGAPWRGAADEEGVLNVQVPAGTHRVEIRREGFVSYVADVNVRPNAATPLNVLLQREN